MGDFIYPIILSLKINALFEKSNIFKGEIIEENEHCIQKGELKLGEVKYVGELNIGLMEKEFYIRKEKTKKNIQ